MHIFQVTITRELNISQLEQILQHVQHNLVLVVLGRQEIGDKEDNAKSFNKNKDTEENKCVEKTGIKTELKAKNEEEIIHDTITLEPQINPLPCSDLYLSMMFNKKLKRIQIKFQPISHLIIENQGLKFPNCKILHLKWF